MRHLIFSNTMSENIELQEIAEIIKGKQLNKENMSGGKYYLLNGGKLPSGRTNEWNVEKNTITISEGGESCGFVNFNIERFYCGGHCYYLKLNENINSLYLYNYLKFKESEIMRLRVGSGLPNIQKRDLMKLEVKINYDEQKNIGELLQLIVKKIELTVNELKLFNEFKKSLLAKMFC